MLYENGKRNNTVKLTALMLGFLMVLSAFSVLFSGNVYQTTSEDNSFAIPSELLPIFEDAEDLGEAIEAAKTMPAVNKIDEILLNHFDEKENSMEISMTPEGNPRIITFAAPSVNLAGIANSMEISSRADMGIFEILIGSVSDKSSMFALARNPSVLLITADAIETTEFNAMEDEFGLDVIDDRNEVQQNTTGEHYGVDDVWATGTDGTGVTVGLLDSGTDFGQTNLGQALALDIFGYPSSMVPDSSGIHVTTVDIEESVITNATYNGIFGLQNTSITFPFSGDGGRYRDCPTEDILFDFTASAIHTESGTYKFGVIFQDFTDGNRWPKGGQTTFFVLTDSTTSGVYDEIYICWEMSAISNWLRGTMYSMYYHALDTTYFEVPIGAGYGQDIWKLDQSINDTMHTATGEWIKFDYDTALLAEEMWVTKTWVNDTHFGDYNVTDGGGWDALIQGNVSNILDAPAGVFVKAGEWTAAGATAALLDDDDKVDSYVLAHDFDGDGYNDISAGSLANAIDYNGLLNEGNLISGIAPDGAGIAVMWDDHSHGTWTASAIAARPNKPYRIYDNYTADGYFGDIGFGWYGIGYATLPDNATEYYLNGFAPGANVMAVNLFTSSAYITSFLWQAGFDLNMPDTPDYGSVWEYTGTHAAQVSSNSWGWTNAYRFTVGSPGLNFANIIIDILSTPNYFDASYPGMLFCFSSGNAGMGSGTFGGFSMSTSALTVGGSTMKHAYESGYGYGVVHDQLYYASSRGPSTQGYSGVDVLANGYRGASNTPVWDHGYAENRPESAGTYGGSGNLTFGFWQGTSLACPMAAGLAALVADELGAFNPQDVKSIIKTTAIDLGFDSFTQGTGRIDPGAAVDMAADGYGWIGSEKTSDVNADMLYDLFEAWFIDNAYGDYEDEYGHMPGSQIAYHHIFADYMTSITDTDFYAGVLVPGESSLGTMDFDNDTGITVSAVYNELTNSVTDTYITDNVSAMWASLYNETMIIVDMADLGLTQAMFDDADMIDVEVIDVNGSSADGVVTRTPAIINWVDTDADDVCDFDVEAGQAAGEGEFGIVAFMSEWYTPVARPSGTFTSLSDASIALRFTGTQNNTFNATGQNETIYEYYSIGDFHFDITINVYERVAWDWVEVTGPAVAGTEWDVNLTVPADALPGIYGGYLEADTGELVPISVGVKGIVPQRTPLGTQMTYWNDTVLVGNALYDNYKLKFGGVVGEGDHHYFPISVGATASVLYLDFASEATLDVRIIDYMGVTIDQTVNGISLVDISAYKDVSTDFYLCIRAAAVPYVNTPVNISAAWTDVGLDVIMPDCDLAYSGDNLYPSALVGPEVEITATYGTSTIFPEIDVTDLEIWVIGVTTVQVFYEFTGLLPAGGHDSEYFDLGVNDIVDIAFGWTGSEDSDATVYDPDGNALGLGMGTLANPEVGHFVAAIAGEYEIEIIEYTGSADADYYIDIDILRPSPVVAAGKAVTVNTQNMTGLYVDDGTYLLEVWGFTNARTVWKHYQEYTVNNWLPPNVVMTNTDVAITSRGTGTTTISWTCTDPNGDEILYNVYYKLIAPPTVVPLPSGLDVLQVPDWNHLLTTEDTSLIWDFSDMSLFPGGMICEFMVMASDGSGEIGIAGVTQVVLDFADPVATTPTVIVPTTVVSTTTITANGFTVLMMLAGLAGLIIIRRRRK